MSLLLEIITPNEKAYSQVVDSVLLTTTDGEVGILPGHIPLLSVLEPGELSVSQNGNWDSLAIDKGFVKVEGDKVSVLTEAAIHVDAIDLEEIEAAYDRANQALKDAELRKDLEFSEIENLESFMRFSVAQQYVKKKKK